MKSPEADLGLLQRPRRCWSPLLESASGVWTLKSNDITYYCPVGYDSTFCWVLQTTTMEYAIRHFPSNYWLQKGPGGTQLCPTTLLQQLEDFFAQYRGKSWKATSYKYEKFNFYGIAFFTLTKNLKRNLQTESLSFRIFPGSPYLFNIDAALAKYILHL